MTTHFILESDDESNLVLITNQTSKGLVVLSQGETQITVDWKQIPDLVQELGRIYNTSL